MARITYTPEERKARMDEHTRSSPQRSRRSRRRMTGERFSTSPASCTLTPRRIACGSFSKP